MPVYAPAVGGRLGLRNGSGRAALHSRAVVPAHYAATVLLLQFCYKSYTEASQNLPYKNRKTAMRFFSARFLGISFLLIYS
jgi:hypothetical protein